LVKKTRKELVRNRRIGEFFAAVVIAGAMVIAFACNSAGAAELVLFEQAGCPWCAVFDREIAPIYGKTAEGRRAPLRRVDITRPLATDLAFIEVERLTPLFVLIDQGREIGRIRGYPGEDHFWGLLDVLIGKLDSPGTGGERAEIVRKSLHAID
jgi:hypothetical protein